MRPPVKPVLKPPTGDRQILLVPLDLHCRVGRAVQPMPNLGLNQDLVERYVGATWASRMVASLCIAILAPAFASTTHVLSVHTVRVDGEAIWIRGLGHGETTPPTCPMPRTAFGGAKNGWSLDRGNSCWVRPTRAAKWPINVQYPAIRRPTWLPSRVLPPSITICRRAALSRLGGPAFRHRPVTNRPGPDAM